MSALEDTIRKAGKPVLIGEDGFTKDFTFDKDFIGFDGHFPGNPILPAVVQLMAGSMAATEAIDATTGKQVTPVGAGRAKFLKQIAPGDLLKVTGKLKSKKDETIAVISILVSGETAATFHITLGGGL
ncbi:3-hydroxyacyl-ACP dehydratase FabZ family protein [Pseudodesulfovibrio sediminis]|uniref:ApeI dehydratase-like domain-containing protein n=1 Tax=Pseudodesulfovibrio sediminis TaxID=2810563 RepID=A0ABN6ETE6_9BACT|nr:hypothetical protein [Pseudodesulfovibrio sediminis]BCS88445.1 hypothetical protein PSDVSF_16870 [Pseudodesulfovibrio sediminis]